MEKIKEFLILITTPGSEMPADVQIIVILLLAALAILLPKLYRWYYERTRGPRKPKK